MNIENNTRYPLTLPVNSFAAKPLITLCELMCDEKITELESYINVEFWSEHLPDAVSDLADALSLRLDSRQYGDEPYVFIGYGFEDNIGKWRRAIKKMRQVLTWIETQAEAEWANNMAGRPERVEATPDELVSTSQAWLEAYHRGDIFSVEKLRTAGKNGEIDGAFKTTKGYYFPRTGLDRWIREHMERKRDRRSPGIIPGLTPDLQV